MEACLEDFEQKPPTPTFAVRCNLTQKFALKVLTKDPITGLRSHPALVRLDGEDRRWVYPSRLHFLCCIFLAALLSSRGTLCRVDCWD